MQSPPTIHFDDLGHESSGRPAIIQPAGFASAQRDAVLYHSGRATTAPASIDRQIQFAAHLCRGQAAERRERGRNHSIFMQSLGFFCLIGQKWPRHRRTGAVNDTLVLLDGGRFGRVADPRQRRHWRRHWYS